MNVLKMKKIALALGSLALVGAATEASALPEFTIQPGAIKASATIPGGLGPLDAIAGNSSERLLAGAGNTFSGNGLIELTTFNEAGSAVYSPKFQGGYQLYILFSLSDVLTSGTYGAVGSTYALTSLTYRIFADVNNNDVFTQATAGVDPFASNNGDDVMLGFGSLVVGNAAINNGGGSTGGALNSTETLSLCSGNGQAKTGNTVSTTGLAASCASNVGTSYFVAPNPFYSVTFDQFNNTTAVFSNGVLVLTQGTGSFNFAVPEPDSLALFGVAAVAAGLAARRRRKSA